MYLVSGESLCLDWDLAWAVKGACDWTLGQAGAQGTEYCNTCEYGRYVCVVCLGTCLGLLEPFVNKCVYIYFMTTTNVCGSSTLHHPFQSPHPQTTWGDRPVLHCVCVCVCVCLS